MPGKGGVLVGFHEKFGTKVAEKGYRMLSAGVVDMFPHTTHSEAMAVFEASPSDMPAA